MNLEFVDYPDGIMEKIIRKELNMCKLCEHYNCGDQCICICHKPPTAPPPNDTPMPENKDRIYFYSSGKHDEFCICKGDKINSVYCSIMNNTPPNDTPMPESVEEMMESVDEWFGEFMNDKVVIPQRRGFPKEAGACLYSLRELVSKHITTSYTAGQKDRDHDKTKEIESGLIGYQNGYTQGRTSIIKEINEKYGGNA